MKLKCRIISTIIASKGSEEKFPGWVSRHITLCTHCGAEAIVYAKLQNTLKSQHIEQECSLTVEDMMAALQTAPCNMHNVRRRPVLSLATACMIILVAVTTLVLINRSGPDKPGSGKPKPSVVVQQTLPEPQHEKVPLPERPSIDKKEIKPTQSPVVVANSKRFVQSRPTYKPQHAPIHVNKKPVPYQKHKTISKPEPEIIEQVQETETNVAINEPDPIMIVPEDRVIEVVRDDQNFDNECSYEIQLVNTDDSSNYAVPL